MKRKAGIAIGMLPLTGVVAFFVIGPGWIERDLNRIDGEPLIEVSQEARDLHARLQIVDLHSDTLLWKRNVLDRADRGHVDLPRLKDGNIALQVFSSVTKSPRGQNYDSNTGETDNITPLVIGQLQPVRTWGSLLERSLWHATKLDRAVEEERDTLFQINGREDIERLIRSRDMGRPSVGAMLSIEGLHNLEGDPGNLDTLHAAGFRMAGLAHFFDNDLAGSMHGTEKGGLTDKGRAVVRRMEELGMVVDIAHCSPACVGDILSMARRPVVSSHGGVQATCEVNRNLSDEQIRGVAATGGIIGVGYWPGAVCDTSPRSVAKAMRHIRDLVGIGHVALGSDFDGSVTTRFDTSQLVQVTQALMDEGFTEEEIRAAMGGNALRVLTAGIEPMELAS
ncbi:amidohydrolase family protein [Erythrobacter gaetbuli]|uniref:Amidohydrolase family protein n=1 Tax=Qipengyuania gaetbuli TaxID=266952 RepID=A0A844Y3K4_9SPHN|nr:dipeptidase [Qipengyuania gaetbuli]MXO51997.1 amidohydrolase family protein [Qipengyuania gaetbuli]